MSFTKIAASEILLNNLRNLNLNLIKDPKRILDLPEGFTYKIISKHKDLMNDGLMVPNAADGMACFKGSGNNIMLVRNHELGHFPNLGKLFNANNPFGKFFAKYLKKNKDKIYDINNNKTECFGCTTTMVYNAKRKELVNQYLSLAGTLVNCSGGPTPWGTWITCEETVKSKSDGLNEDHGYCFEVEPSEKRKLSVPAPLKDMGRFRHEAIAVDPQNHFIYET